MYKIHPKMSLLYTSKLGRKHCLQWSAISHFLCLFLNSEIIYYLHISVSSKNEHVSNFLKWWCFPLFTYFAHLFCRLHSYFISPSFLLHNLHKDDIRKIKVRFAVKNWWSRNKKASILYFLFWFFCILCVLRIYNLPRNKVINTTPFLRQFICYLHTM